MKTLTAFLLALFLCPYFLNGQSFTPINFKPNIVAGGGLTSGNEKLKIVFPATDTGSARAIWSSSRGLNFLNTAALNLRSKAGSAFVDIASDFLGPVRVSLASAVASSNDSTENEDDIERFLSGGGSAILNFHYIGPSILWGKESYLSLLLNPKVGFDLPAFGATTDDSSVNFDLGGDIKFYFPLSQNVLGFTGNYRFSYVIGGDKFYENLGFTESDYNPFTYMQVSIGLAIPVLNAAIVWNKTLSAPKSLTELHENGRISLIVSP